MKARRRNEGDLDSSGAANILTRISRDGRKSSGGGEEEKIRATRRDAAAAILITSRNVTRAAAFAIFDDELRKKMAHRLNYE